MKFVITSSKPGRTGITTVVISSAASTKAAIHRAALRAKWPTDAILTVEAECLTAHDIAAAASGNYRGSSGLSDPR